MPTFFNLYICLHYVFIGWIFRIWKKLLLLFLIYAYGFMDTIIGIKKNKFMVHTKIKCALLAWYIITYYGNCIIYNDHDLMFGRNI